MKPINFTSRLIVSSVILLLSITGIFFGVRVLRKYNSDSFVLYESIQNLHKERENTIKSKNVFLNNLDKIESLSNHIVSSEEEIPYLASKIEEYADSVGSDITINSISLSEPGKSNRIISLDIDAIGSFDKLLKTMKMIENAEYVINMNEYSLREVAIIQPNRAGGSVTYRDISFTGDSSFATSTTWMLSAKLTLNTNIK